MREVLFKELSRSRHPFSMLLSGPSARRVPCRRRSVVGAALEWVDLKTQGVVLLSANPSEWINLTRAQQLDLEAGDTPLRTRYAGPIFAAVAAGDGLCNALHAVASLAVLVEDKSTGSQLLLSCNHVSADYNRASPRHTVISDRGALRRNTRAGNAVRPRPRLPIPINDVLNATRRQGSDQSAI
jgi:hypothetical protein